MRAFLFAVPTSVTIRLQKRVLVAGFAPEVNYFRLPCSVPKHCRLGPLSHPPVKQTEQSCPLIFALLQDMSVLTGTNKHGRGPVGGDTVHITDTSDARP